MSQGPSIPVGVNLTTIGVDTRWWLDTASRLEAAGYAGVWAWDHFVSRGRLDRPDARVLDHARRDRGRDRPHPCRQLREQRHEPAPGGARADGRHGRRPGARTGRAGHRHRWPSRGAHRLRHRVPGTPGTGGAAGRGGRSHPRPVHRRAGEHPGRLVPAGRGVRLAGTACRRRASSSAASDPPVRGSPLASPMAGPAWNRSTTRCGRCSTRR